MKLKVGQFCGGANLQQTNHLIVGVIQPGSQCVSRCWAGRVHLSQATASPITDIGLLITGQRDQSLHNGRAYGAIDINTAGQGLSNREPDIRVRMIDTNVVQDDLGSLKIPGEPQCSHSRGDDLGVGFTSQYFCKLGQSARDILDRTSVERVPELVGE